MFCPSAGAKYPFFRLQLMDHFGYVPSFKDWYISWDIDVNWFIHEYPELKPDWFWEIKLFSIKHSNRSLHIKRSKFFVEWEAKKQVDSFLKSAYPLFYGQEQDFLFPFSRIFSIHLSVFLDHIQLNFPAGFEDTLLYEISEEFFSLEI